MQRRYKNEALVLLQRGKTTLWEKFQVTIGAETGEADAGRSMRFKTW